MNNTIAAISTSVGIGAISIIRVSGNNAIDIVNKVFKGSDLDKAPSHTINYGHIVNKEEIIDEVLVNIMRAPKTFTKEDIVEINCHGGISTTTKILELLILNGAKLAEPGEFTKRAFLNGRIDLVEAEAIMDLINSKSDKSRKMALKAVSGQVSNLIKILRKQLLEIIASIEVNIDYPEYEDIEKMTNVILLPKIKNVKEKLENIIKESENCQIIKNGIKLIIIGRPNVGKSSILNKLLDEEKAIVTDIAGTTRDIVEGTINLDGIILNISDTAGIRKTSDIIEKIGVDKSIKLIDDTDLVLLILNNNEEIQKDDIDLINILEEKDKKYIIVINKMDLPKKIDKKLINNLNVVECTTTNREGLNEIKYKIKELFNFEELENSDLEYLSNIRQVSLLKEALNNIIDVENGINKNLEIDILEIDIRTAWLLLGEIIGETFKEELIDQLFSQFCLGK
jgi:tRNA modification GTPase